MVRDTALNGASESSALLGCGLFFLGGLLSLLLTLFVGVFRTLVSHLPDPPFIRFGEGCRAGNLPLCASHVNSLQMYYLPLQILLKVPQYASLLVFQATSLTGHVSLLREE